MEHGHSAEDFVEVYDEPDHACCIDNGSVYAYRVILPQQHSTLWHRHTGDTVYFSLADARSQQQFPAAEAIVLETPCGAALSRPHHKQPLIHKVTNVGTSKFHMIGVEARPRNKAGDAPAINLTAHTCVFETDRFRVYRVQLAQASATFAYASAGVLIALTARAKLSCDGGEAVAMEAGDLRWLNAEQTIEYEGPFDGYFAQLR